MKTQQELQAAGFTLTGSKRYGDTVNDYSETLFKKSVIYGEASKADDANLEVTHDHVRAAAHNIASTFAKEKPSTWCLPVQIGEYLFTLGAGVGGGAYKETWGIPVFVACIALGVILFVVRNTTLKR